MKIARYLAEVIGPRVSGTPKELAAAEFIQSKFKELNLNTRIQKFKYLGWRQDQKPSLTVLSPFKKSLDVAPMAYTGSTAAGGVEGVLQYHGTYYLFPKLMEPPKYALVDDQGEKVAFVLVLPGNRTRPIPNQWLHIFQDPMILVNEDDFKPLKEAIAANQEVRVLLKSTAEYFQSVTSCNVIASLEGESKETIVIGGHHDSVEDSPGAIDNASGVEAIFRVAEKLCQRKRKYSYKLITWGGHEWGLFGSQYFVKDAKERGVIKQIKACLTLDVLGCGEYLWVWAGPPAFRKKIESSLSHSDLIQKREIRYEDTLIGSDDWSFSLEDIPGAMLMDWPMDTLHLPEDVYETIDEAKVNFAVEMTFSLLENFEKEGI
jgi:aminopeptidase YwaD